VCTHHVTSVYSTHATFYFKNPSLPPAAPARHRGTTIMHHPPRPSPGRRVVPGRAPTARQCRCWPSTSAALWRPVTAWSWPCAPEGPPVSTRGSMLAPLGTTAACGTRVYTYDAFGLIWSQKKRIIRDFQSNYMVRSQIRILSSNAS
jgi:hypothetical protein